MKTPYEKEFELELLAWRNIVDALRQEVATMKAGRDLARAEAAKLRIIHSTSKPGDPGLAYFAAMVPTPPTAQALAEALEVSASRVINALQPIMGGVGIDQEDAFEATLSALRTTLTPVLAKLVGEKHRMCARVLTGDYSEDCPFCLVKPQTPGVPNPMCHLCEVEADLSSARAERDAAVKRAEDNAHQSMANAQSSDNWRAEAAELREKLDAANETLGEHGL